MKKVFYASVLGAVILSSCSNESVPCVDEPNVQGLEPVALGLNMSYANVETTRGTGTVGGTTDADNIWNYENLYVLMTTSDPAALQDKNAEWGFTSVGGQVLREQFDNTFFSRPKQTERDGSPVWVIDYTCDPNEGGNVKYYPASGESDFFAYYVDDAANNDAQGNPEYVMENNTISIPYTLDGSQDLMLGKAEAPSGYKGFSARTARENIVPKIRMKHLLSRFTFTLKNGNIQTKDVKIKSISIESPNKGKMLVAYKSAPTNVIEWDKESKAKLYLKEAAQPSDPNYFVSSLTEGKCPLKELTPVTMDGVSDVNVGEALFVCPGTNLTMYVDAEFPVEVNGVLKTETRQFPMTLNHPDGENKQFEAGKSYHVNATIYGLEKVSIDVQLEKWIEGGDIDVNSDNIKN